MSDTLQELKDYLDQMNIYGRAAELLFWDMRTIMPKNGFEKHAQASTFFSTEVFKMSTSDKLEKIIDELMKPEEYEKLDDMWKYVVKKMKKEFVLDKRIPTDFYEEYVQASTESEAAWEEAKNAKDFSIFAPHLEKMIEYTKKMMQYREPDKEIYDALLNQYEEGMDSETIDRLFA